VVLDGKGNIVSRSIDGQIVMRSFLSGCPNLTVQLNDDLVVGPSGYGSVKFVDVNFHDAVVSQDFARTRSLSLYPPEGEYKVIGYRAETNAPLPLVVLASFGDSERIKHDLYLRVRCELPAGTSPRHPQRCDHQICFCLTHDFILLPCDSKLSRNVLRRC
jgi:hypothetical protein